MELFIREELVAEAGQFRQSVAHGIDADPLPIGIVLSYIVEVFGNQGHVIVAVETQFSALTQQHIAEILETLDILVARELALDPGRIILDHKTCIADIIFFGEIIDIFPPVVGIEVLDVHPVIVLDELAVSLRNRGRKIIDVKGGTVDDRPDAVILQKRIGRTVKSPVCFFQKAQVVKDDRAAAQCPPPDQGSIGRTGTFQKDLTVIVQGDIQGRTIGV